ncbi:MAG: DUF2096 family protein [Candidatus Bathyarchaeia archaeon]
MARNLTSWKLLEDMMLELKKAGVVIPAKTIEDLRSAKSLIKLSCMPNSGDAIQKAEEYLANVEAFVMTEGQKAFGEERVDGWLRQLEEANIEVCAEAVTVEEKYVVGMPRDQKWVRVEPIGELTAEKIGQIAKEQNMQVKNQKDGKLVVYGRPENLKAFLKKMTTEKYKQ